MFNLRVPLNFGTNTEKKLLPYFRGANNVPGAVVI